MLFAMAHGTIVGMSMMKKLKNSEMCANMFTTTPANKCDDMFVDKSLADMWHKCALKLHFTTVLTGMRSDICAHLVTDICTALSSVFVPDIRRQGRHMVIFAKYW